MVSGKSKKNPIKNTFRSSQHGYSADPGCLAAQAMGGRTGQLGSACVRPYDSGCSGAARGVRGVCAGRVRGRVRGVCAGVVRQPARGTCAVCARQGPRGPCGLARLCGSLGCPGRPYRCPKNIYIFLKLKIIVLKFIFINHKTPFNLI